MAELTDEEQSALACRCHAGICPLHNEASDGYVEHQASDLLAIVERILTTREAAAERRGAVNALRTIATQIDIEIPAMRTDHVLPYDRLATWLRERAGRIEVSDD